MVRTVVYGVNYPTKTFVASDEYFGVASVLHETLTLFVH
ncbi:MAG: hypothetical protein UX47_C0001G0008 [Candidatus Collierbacteria bacterium GW2011_GWA2_46_26]|uniref:Uncharacterized protein n=1 Tax=Candidatus Collierbacteria bacterium GW2011_GWA2_46_26 TaxID=1618381 RepID=A0A0G1SKB2_9BACT|nr:MAG: hypothetical protein UW29_C0004G0225 [Candidatus Collierbacteria bacterium GW2011_GWC2_44_13]KKU33725.1 MAG: hypothetical protein UX47_C0001G0008 [Candidatus Collierbacteria bacterium GW2011_GWA2_46_26]